MNANGGINGRPIEYHVEDDQWNPEAAAAAAAKLVNDQKAVAMVGNGSFIRNSYDSILDPKKINSYLYRPIAINELKVDAELAQRRIPIVFGNQELFQNMVDYMMGDNSVLDIRSRQIDIKEIDKEKIKSASLFYKSINMLTPLLVILALAFVMNWIRLRRYTR